MAEPTSAKSLGEKFKSGLKGLVFEDSPEESSKPAVETKPVSIFGSTAPVERAPAKQVFSTPTPSVAEVDPQIKAMLEVDINEAAKPAYTKFVAVEQSLASIIADERTRFQAAVASISSDGHTVDKIIFDLDECLETLDKKERDNEAAVREARERKIGSKQKQLANLEAKLIDLQKQIEICTADKAKIQAEISNDEQQISATNEKFTGAVAAYRKDLQDRKSKISQLGR